MTFIDSNATREVAAIYPTIHLNGTSGGELLTQALAALDATRKLESALADMAPNMRDYYTQGPDAFGAAVASHQARLKAAGKIRREIEGFAEYISDRV